MSKYYPNKPIENKAVLYFLNSKCNRKCAQCYLKETKGKSRKLKTAILDIEALLSDNYKVIPVGSEVLLNSEYLKVYQLTSRKYVRSNGMLIAEKPELAERIKESGLDNVILTLTLNNSSKILRTTSAKILEKAISISLNAGLNVCGSVVICKQNYQNLEKIIEYALKKGVSVIDFLNLMPTNLDLAQFTLDDSEIRQFFKQITQLKKDIPKEKLYITVSRTFGIKYRPNKESLMKQGKTCPAGTKLKVIGLDNKVYPCLFLMRPEDAIGEFKQGKIKLYKPETQKIEWDCLARKKLVEQKCQKKQYGLQ